MKNCLEFSVVSLNKYLMMMGLLEVIDMLHQFAVITDVITLDRNYLKTTDLSKMKYCAFQNEYGYNLVADSGVVRHLVELLTNPRSLEETLKMNSALKTLDLRKNGNAYKFYELLGEAMHRRLIFQKLTQIYASLIEEIKINQEFLLILVNNKLIDLGHLQELAWNNQTPIRTAHYIIHNINSYRKLMRFTFLCQQWCRDINMVNQLLEIQFEIEMYQLVRLAEMIEEDSKKKACFIY